MNTYLVGQVAPITLPGFKSADEAAEPTEPRDIRVVFTERDGKHRRSISKSSLVSNGVPGQYRVDFKVPAPGWWTVDVTTSDDVRPTAYRDEFYARPS